MKALITALALVVTATPALASPANQHHLWNEYKATRPALDAAWNRKDLRTWCQITSQRESLLIQMDRDGVKWSQSDAALRNTAVRNLNLCVTKGYIATNPHNAPQVVQRPQLTEQQQLERINNLNGMVRGLLGNPLMLHYGRETCRREHGIEQPNSGGYRAPIGLSYQECMKRVNASYNQLR